MQREVDSLIWKSVRLGEGYHHPGRLVAGRRGTFQRVTLFNPARRRGTRETGRTARGRQRAAPQQQFLGKSFRIRKKISIYAPEKGGIQVWAPPYVKYIQLIFKLFALSSLLQRSCRFPYQLPYRNNRIGEEQKGQRGNPKARLAWAERRSHVRAERYGSFECFEGVAR